MRPGKNQQQFRIERASLSATILQALALTIQGHVATDRHNSAACQKLAFRPLRALTAIRTGVIRQKGVGIFSLSPGMNSIEGSLSSMQMNIECVPDSKTGNWRCTAGRQVQKTSSGNYRICHGRKQLTGRPNGQGRAQDFQTAYRETDACKATV
jgi:hypothetical protein